VSYQGCVFIWSIDWAGESPLARLPWFIACIPAVWKLVRFPCAGNGGGAETGGVIAGEEVGAHPTHTLVGFGIRFGSSVAFGSRAISIS